ncbi:MAG: 23S rRNA (adenine(2503)-C(2))-methyltransferase RlmN, partial [Tepidisphaeraceae bacterium]
MDLTCDEWEQKVRDWGWPAYRAGQVWEWVYSKLVLSPDGMTNLGKLQREALVKSFTFGSAHEISRQISADGTCKLLLAWPDGATAETVMIPDANRRTACVSSQVGCPVGCKFCASGIGGARGNLSAGQIVEQILRSNQILAPAGERITNVVFMGMGEPLANYANVIKAVRILHDPRGLNIGARRITI